MGLRLCPRGEQMTNKTYYDSYEYLKGLVPQIEESPLEKDIKEIEVLWDTPCIQSMSKTGGEE